MQATIQAPAHPAAVTQGVPKTGAELEALTLKRAELSNQLQGLTERRRELSDQRGRMGREEGRDHDARIRVLDQRSGQIEQELLQADQGIASALANGVRRSGGEPMTLDVTGSLAVDEARADRIQIENNILRFGALAALVVTFVLVWRGVRRFFTKKAVPVPNQSVNLAQLQQSVDTIAIEVERISEAQRFVAKMLNEKLPSLGVGDAQQLSMKAKDPAPVRHEERR